MISDHQKPTLKVNTSLSNLSNVPQSTGFSAFLNSANKWKLFSPKTPFGANVGIILDSPFSKSFGLTSPFGSNFFNGLNGSGLGSISPVFGKSPQYLYREVTPPLQNQVDEYKVSHVEIKKPQLNKSKWKRRIKDAFKRNKLNLVQNDATIDTSSSSHTSPHNAVPAVNLPSPNGTFEGIVELNNFNIDWSSVFTPQVTQLPPTPLPPPPPPLPPADENNQQFLLQWQLYYQQYHEQLSQYQSHLQAQQDFLNKQMTSNNGLIPTVNNHNVNPMEISTKPKKQKTSVASFSADDKPHKCPYFSVCNQQFTRKHDLIRHVRIHENDLPFGCDKCTKRFSRQDALKRHLEISAKYGGRCRITRGRVPKSVLKELGMEKDEE